MTGDIEDGHTKQTDEAHSSNGDSFKLSKKTSRGVEDAGESFTNCGSQIRKRSSKSKRQSVFISPASLSSVRAWKKSLILLIVLLCYLFAGAMVFYVVERPPAVLAADRFDAALQKLAAHECVGDEGVEELMGIMTSAIKEGALHIRSAEIAVRTRGMTNESLIRDRWSLDHSFLFALTVVTTIGFGNLAPRTELGQFVCVMYALIGIPLAAGFLWAIANVLSLFLKVNFKAIERISKCTKSERVKKAIFILSSITFFYVILITLPSVAYWQTEDWTYTECHYFTVIAMTTIGLGDVVPGHNSSTIQSLALRWLSRIMLSVYLFLGLGVISMLLISLREKQQRAVKTLSRTVQRQMVRIRQFQRPSPLSRRQAKNTDSPASIRTNDSVISGTRGPGFQIENDSPVSIRTEDPKALSPRGPGSQGGKDSPLSTRTEDPRASRPHENGSQVEDNPAAPRTEDPSASSPHGPPLRLQDGKVSPVSARTEDRSESSLQGPALQGLSSVINDGRPQGIVSA